MFLSIMIKRWRDTTKYWTNYGRSVFLFWQKHILYFDVLLSFVRSCVAAIGVMCFSVRSFGCALFYFGEEILWKHRKNVRCAVKVWNGKKLIRRKKGFMWEKQRQEHCYLDRLVWLVARWAKRKFPIACGSCGFEHEYDAWEKIKINWLVSYVLYDYKCYRHTFLGYVKDMMALFLLRNIKYLSGYSKKQTGYLHQCPFVVIMRAMDVCHAWSA